MFLKGGIFMKMKHLFAGLVATLALGAATTVGVLVANKNAKEVKVAEAAGAAGKIFYFQNTRNWSNMYVHLFGGTSSSDTSWPGIKLSTVVGKDSGHDMYIFRTDGDYTSYILNNGSGTQTVDLSFSSFTGTNDAIWISDQTENGKNKAGGYYDYNYTPIESGAFLRGSAIGWNESDQATMTATGNANEYSITRDFVANEQVKVFNYTGLATGSYVNIGSLNCNHSSAYPVSQEGGNVKVTNAGNYTLTINVSTGAYSFAANDFVTPSAQIAYSNGSDGETSTYSSATEQSEILVYLNQGESFTVKHVTSFGTFYRGYDNLEEGSGSSRTKNDVTKGSLKEGTTYYINVAKSGLYLLYVKDTGAIWMQDAEASPAAYNWATYFLANVGCDANGVNLPSGWSTVSARYSTLTDEAKALIVGGTANENGDELGQALARYDYAVTHHAGLTRFIVGRTISNPSGSRSLSANSVVEAAAPATVAVVGLVSMTAVGGFFFLKKKPF